MGNRVPTTKQISAIHIILLTSVNCTNSIPFVPLLLFIDSMGRAHLFTYDIDMYTWASARICSPLCVNRMSAWVWRTNESSFLSDCHVWNHNSDYYLEIRYARYSSSTQLYDAWNEFEMNFNCTRSTVTIPIEMEIASFQSLICSQPVYEW